MNNKIKLIPVVVLFIITITGVTISFPPVEKAIFNLASTLYDQKKFKTTFILYHLVLFKGYYFAKNNLATMYLDGKGTKKNYKKAFEYFKIAAEKKGGVVSQFNLGSLYATGRGVEQDYNKAFEYYNKAAKGGLKTAQFMISPLYKKCDILYWFIIHIDGYK